MREFRVDAAGASLFAVEDGDGPVVLMLHGGMADHRAARPLVAPLADRYRIVTPDLRASGKSHYGGPLAFDLLADDVERILDHLDVDRAIVGGVSGGSGVAVCFALRRAKRVLGLVVARPMYAGGDRGYTEQQQATFAAMDGVARLAVEDGVQVLRPLYAGLPAGVREKALAMIDEFDPASVVTTSRFLVSAAQPFPSSADLASLEMPVLLIRGDDAMHPAEVSDLYAAAIRDCGVVPASVADVPGAIGGFADRCVSRPS